MEKYLRDRGDVFHRADYDPKHFEPDRYLAVAAELAHSLIPDADLAFIAFRPVESDGHVNLELCEGRCSYEFRSLSRSKLPAGVPRNIRPRLRCSVRVNVEPARIFATVQDDLDCDHRSARCRTARSPRSGPGRSRAKHRATSGRTSGGDPTEAGSSPSSAVATGSSSSGSRTIADRRNQDLLVGCERSTCRAEPLSSALQARLAGTALRRHLSFMSDAPHHAEQARSPTNTDPERHTIHHYERE
jgi:hypothetical protein